MSEAIGTIIGIIFGLIAYCVATAIGFLLYLIPLFIGLWIIGAVIRFIF